MLKRLFLAFLLVSPLTLAISLPVYSASAQGNSPALATSNNATTLTTPFTPQICTTLLGITYEMSQQWQITPDPEMLKSLVDEHLAMEPEQSTYFWAATFARDSVISAIYERDVERPHTPEQDIKDAQKLCNNLQQSGKTYTTTLYRNPAQ